MILTLEGNTPKIGKGTFVAENSTIIGDVAVGENCGLWFLSVLRGDIGSIHIGNYTNVQDHCICHTPPSVTLEVGDYVTVGHRALIHGCKIGNNCLIGMGSIVMNHAEIGDNCIVGAGAVVTEGTKVPPNSLVLGMPARVKRELTAEEITGIRKSAENYFLFSRKYI